MEHHSPFTQLSFQAIPETMQNLYPFPPLAPLQTNDTAEEILDWRELPNDHPCKIYWTTKEEDAKKSMAPPPGPPSPKLLPQLIPETNQPSRPRWEKSHFLSLPKEIRIKIYQHVLKISGEPELLVTIHRKPFRPSYKLIRPPIPELLFSHAESRAPVTIDILLTNRMIYEEALPILYKSARFMPEDLEGLLPLFLTSLSPTARSCLRNIYLCIPDLENPTGLQQDRSKPFFHWAVTCAQVALLNDTLHQVEVRGHKSMFDTAANRRAILFPLCKIKATKKFVAQDHPPGISDADFQKLLKEAEETLKATARLREERNKAEAQERALRERERERETVLVRRKRGIDPLDCATTIPRQTRATNRPQTRSQWRDESMEQWCRWAEENLKRMEQLGLGLEEQSTTDTASGDGTEVVSFEELAIEEWDMMSMWSGTSTPRGRPASAVSAFSDGAEEGECIDPIPSLIIEHDPPFVQVGVGSRPSLIDGNDPRFQEMEDDVISLTTEAGAFLEASDAESEEWEYLG